MEPNEGILLFYIGKIRRKARSAGVSGALEKLLERDFYVDVQLQVKIKVYASQPVTLLGEVQSPGTYYLEGRTTLTDLLSKAGGLKPKR